jgi:hypothetical protein
MPRRHPTRDGLAALEAVAMAGELALSAANEYQLGIAGRALERGRPGQLLKGARALVVGGLAARAARARGGRAAAALDHVPSLLFLAAALAYRLGWVAAGRPSAQDHEAVAAIARSPHASRPARSARTRARQ